MYVSITKIRLKTPFHFFALSLHGKKIRRELKESPCIRSTFTGFGMTHYTQSLWRTKDEMREFTSKAVHLNSMKNGNLAREIKILTIDSTNLIPWREAKALIKRQKASQLS